MFQTEINAWLQSFSVPWLDVFMQIVSFLGNGEIVAAILILLIMGVDLRKGLTILIAVLLASAVTNSLKNVFEMPRPVFLSSAVGEPGDSSPPPTFYEDGGGSTFWSLPKPEAIDKMREIQEIHDEGADGLPSGHVATAAALSFAIAFVFAGFRFLPLALFWTFIMALSRMYLGRHFLADVLLGAVIGVFIVWCIIKASKPFLKEVECNDHSAKILFSLLAGFSVLFALFSFAETKNLGELSGAAAGIIAILAIGLPNSEANFFYRVLRVVLAGGVYAVLSVICSAIKLEEILAGAFIQGFVLIFFTCFIPVLIGKATGLFKAKEVAST